MKSNGLINFIKSLVSKPESPFTLGSMKPNLTTENGLFSFILNEMIKEISFNKETMVISLVYRMEESVNRGVLLHSFTKEHFLTVLARIKCNMNMDMSVKKDQQGTRSDINFDGYMCSVEFTCVETTDTLTVKVDMR
jgi:hypothetical protein